MSLPRNQFSRVRLCLPPELRRKARALALSTPPLQNTAAKRERASASYTLRESRMLEQPRKHLGVTITASAKRLRCVLHKHKRQQRRTKNGARFSRCNGAETFFRLEQRVYTRHSAILPRLRQTPPAKDPRK